MRPRKIEAHKLRALAKAGFDHITDARVYGRIGSTFAIGDLAPVTM